MNEQQVPVVAAEAYNNAVVKWQDNYFISRRGKWVPVQLISPDEQAAAEQRADAELGIGAALIVTPFLIWGVVTVVGAVLGTGIVLSTFGLGVAASIGFWILIVLGVAVLTAGFIERVRLRRNVAVAARGTLRGASQWRGGMPRFTDLDSA